MSRTQEEIGAKMGIILIRVKFNEVEPCARRNPEQTVKPTLKNQCVHATVKAVSRIVKKNVIYVIYCHVS